MKETRLNPQVKVWKLVMNDMRCHTEHAQLVAVSDDKDKLVSWYRDQMAEMTYSDPGINQFSGGPTNWHKTFKKGSLLEWFNAVDVDQVSLYNHGFLFEWVDEKYYYTEDVPYLKIV